MEIDATVNVAAVKEKTKKLPKTTRRATVKRKPPKRQTDALVASENAGIDAAEATSARQITASESAAPPTPVARAKRTRSPRKKPAHRKRPKSCRAQCPKPSQLKQG